jgi:positive regulator of sigma E activity
MYVHTSVVVIYLSLFLSFFLLSMLISLGLTNNISLTLGVLTAFLMPKRYSQQPCTDHEVQTPGLAY